MKKTFPTENSPFYEQEAAAFQFSLASLLIAMAVFSVMSACLLWACRLPLVTDELHAWMGTVASTNKDGTDRGMQLMFLLFCYSTPLLLAGTLNLLFVTVRFVQRTAKQSSTETDKQWEMET
jgi:small-conductance mechanosensitive channel